MATRIVTLEDRVILMATAASRLVLTLITLLALGLTDARAQPTACGSDIRRIEVNQTTLHYFECGKGEPLIFVHGSTGDLHTFRAQVQAFATSFRVIAYSRRFSPPNAPPRETDVNPMSNHVADLRALITQLKATPTHLVGNSYGAYVALALALDHPELVRSLVLGEPPVMSLLARTSVGRDMGLSFVRRVREPSRKAFEGGDLEDGLRKFMDEICGTGCFDNPPAFFPRRTELVEKQGPEFRSHFMTEPSAYMPPLDCGNLGKLTRPTLLVTGERSPAFILLSTAELERCLEGESQVMVPEAGHTMHRENTAFYNQAVLAFLQQRR
jgi:pimeloyl-ACP methyl ester carboxylesterase